MTVSALLKTAHSILHQVNPEAYAYHHQLDLTYITSRVLVCSEPVNTQFPYWLFKNNINDILEFLNSRYKDHWMVYNLQQEQSKYLDCQVFGNIEHFAFPDHNPPPFHMLVRIVQSIEDYLRLDKDNVVLIHCKAGKGRTGTVVCSYLMKHYGMTASMANAYYTEKRMRFGEGVSIKSQKRYLGYFEQYRNASVGGASSKKKQYGQSRKLWLKKIRIVNPYVGGDYKNNDNSKNNEPNLVVSVYDYSKTAKVGNVWNNIGKVAETKKVGKEVIEEWTCDGENNGKSVIAQMDVRVVISQQSAREQQQQQEYASQPLTFPLAMPLSFPVSLPLQLPSNLLRWNWAGEHCAFWINGAFETYGNSKGEVRVRYEDMDGIKGLGIKPGLRILDAVEVEYEVV